MQTHTPKHTYTLLIYLITYIPAFLRKYQLILVAVFLKLLLENLVLEMRSSSRNDISSDPENKQQRFITIKMSIPEVPNRDCHTGYKY